MASSTVISPEQDVAENMSSIEGVVLEMHLVSIKSFGQEIIITRLDQG